VDNPSIIIETIIVRGAEILGGVSRYESIAYTIKLANSGGKINGNNTVKIDLNDIKERPLGFIEELSS